MDTCIRFSLNIFVCIIEPAKNKSYKQYVEVNSQENAIWAQQCKSLHEDAVEHIYIHIKKTVPTCLASHYNYYTYKHSRNVPRKKKERYGVGLKSILHLIKVEYSETDRTICTNKREQTSYTPSTLILIRVPMCQNVGDRNEWANGYFIVWKSVSLCNSVIPLMWSGQCRPYFATLTCVLMYLCRLQKHHCCFQKLQLFGFFSSCAVSPLGFHCLSHCYCLIDVS